MMQRGFLCPACDEMFWFDPAREQPVCTCGGRLLGKKRPPTHHFETPIVMHSVGLAPYELDAFKRRCPDIDLTPDGTPIARSRQEKLKILKAMQFEEQN